MSEFRMPALGADMEAGTLAEWRVKVGDRVHSGDVVAVVETQKGAIEVEIFLDGVVTKLVVGEGEQAPVGAVLAEIDGAGGAAAPPPAPAPEKVVAAAAPPVTLAPGGAALRVSPVARRRAAELGIDLATVKPSGVGGSICLADVEAAAKSAAPSPPSKKQGFDFAEMRKAIAAAMSRSKREIPHYYLSETVDAGATLAFLEKFNADRPPIERILPAAAFLKAAALALRETPGFNGFFLDGAFAPSAEVHIGWAIALRGGGLIAPAIRDADKRPLPELMTAMRDLIERARRGVLRSSERTSPTVTITSVGDRGSETVAGIIYPPQVAIVGFGRVSLRPWVVGERIEARPLVNLSLAADHRVSDGHLGGLFLAAIARRLQEPAFL
jgi:pyruvate dehydrogenase E2 component (dihydrolipoamide acetyltransferase)